MKKIHLLIWLIILIIIVFNGCYTENRIINTLPEKPFEQVCAGSYGYMFLTAEGDVYSYGKTQDMSNIGIYFLGIKDADRIDVPTKILSDAVIISDNLGMPAAIKKNGDLYVWGYNGKKQILGFDANIEIVLEPTKLMEGVADVGWGYAIKNNGDLWIWGSYGDVNPSTGEFIATAPYKKLSGVKKCICRAIYYALKEDGSLWAWGYAKESSRGNGKMSIEDSAYNTPVKILDNVADISAVGSHTLALKTDGTLWAWGSNEYGQVGNGENGDLSSKTTDCVVTEPMQIMSGVALIYTSTWCSFAITESGDLYGWGRNTGYLFDKSADVVNTPKLLLKNVKEIDNSSITRCYALTNDGKLYSWGQYGYGILGTDCSYEFNRLAESFDAIGSSGNQLNEQYCYEPTLVTDGVESILGGYELMFAKMQDGNYHYWGMDTYKTVQTYGEANYVEFLQSGVYGASKWYEGMVTAPDFPADAVIPGAIMHHLDIIKYPTECTFPPYIGD
ncbi:MAG TPA: hypothetical protein PK854_06065 [Oscillospiraceae bacterium]|nr:hypothetical protein [Oscillospiraceae bacterium]HPS34811.1 hypothetical protein [Oscillospiraceae bacterium]